MNRRVSKWLAMPVIASVLSVGGIALANNAWHTSTTITGAHGQVGTVQPVTATGAIVGDIYPGLPMTYTVTFNNPNSFAVNVLTCRRQASRSPTRPCIPAPTPR